MLFTELNTDVLLHIYGCLDPIDSINLAETCTRLRDVAQLHYKRFKIFNLEHFIYNATKGLNRRRHNCIGATTVLKHIGPFICDLTALTANLGMDQIRSDVITSIGQYCVNVKTLKIIGGPFTEYDPYTIFSEWLKKLNLTKISLSIPDLYLIDHSETTSLHEVHIHRCSYYRYKFIVDYGRVANILERNVNITCLRIPLIHDFKYEIFGMVKCLKRLILDVDDERGERQLEKVAANLKMTALEKVELKFYTRRAEVGLNEFLEKLSENALHLKHLSIAYDSGMLDAYPLSSLQLLNLTSLRWIDEHPNLYKEIPKMQPNLTHLDLMLYEGSDLDLTSHIGGTLPKPMEQIIFLIENLEKLELLHIRFRRETSISSTLKDFLQESVLCRIFDCHINRPAVTLRLLEARVSSCCRFLRVELDLSVRKWTWTIMEESYLKDFVEHQLLLPFCDLDVESIDDLRSVERFSGSATDLISVKDKANKCIRRLILRWRHLLLNNILYRMSIFDAPFLT